MDPEEFGSSPLPAISLLSVVVMATVAETEGGLNWALGFPETLFALVTLPAFEVLSNFLPQLSVFFFRTCLALWGLKC